MKLLKFNGTCISGFRKQISASCVVRNELNGWRKKEQIVYTIPELIPGEEVIPEPYQPRQFPEGVFKIISVGNEEKPSSIYYPFFIATTATQKVNIWALDDEGNYKYKTDKKVIDTGYGIHHSPNSSTTLGCIRIGTEKEARYIARKIKAILRKDKEIFIEVNYETC